MDTIKSIINSSSDPLSCTNCWVDNFPKNKNFESSRKHFLWFGGGGAILKGLDLVVETFASLPHLQLSIIGPSAYEKEFEEILVAHGITPKKKKDIEHQA